MEEHHQAAIRVLKYIKSALANGLFFPSSSDLKLSGFADLDWGSCLDTRRSIAGFYFFIGTTLISWKCKKQPTVARSSSEAEYRALAAASCEAQWLSFLLKDLQVVNLEAIPIFCDNISAIHIATNPVFQERTKHIEMDCHTMHEKMV